MISIGKAQRLAHNCYKNKMKLFAQIISRYLRVVYSCDISYKANVDPTVNFSHLGLGTVVGSYVTIGPRTKILQNVCIGGRGDHRGPNGESMPTIGADVLIGAGACLLGPIKVGNNSVIGANAVVITDVPEGMIAVGNPARLINKGNRDE